MISETGKPVENWSVKAVRTPSLPHGQPVPAVLSPTALCPGVEPLSSKRHCETSNKDFHARENSTEENQKVRGPLAAVVPMGPLPMYLAFLAGVSCPDILQPRVWRRRTSRFPKQQKRSYQAARSQALALKKW